MKMNELFCVFNNCNDSILALNPFIKRSGFEFVKVGIPELETDFRFLFHLPEEYTTKSTIRYPNGLISDTFMNVLLKSDLIDEYDREYVIFLKSIIGDIPIEKDDYFGHFHLKYIHDFAISLIDKLRLFKSGDIEISTYFSLNIEQKRNIVQNERRSFVNGNQYVVEESEVQELGCFLNENSITNPLALKAKLYFDQSYRININEVRFIVLITSLESILNVNREQISHTFSRHLALMLTQDRNDFPVIYKKIKKLYNLRSQIIHGASKEIENMEDNINELENYVRKSIVAVNKLEFQNSNDLFEHFNNMGV